MEYTIPAKAGSAVFAAFKKRSSICFDASCIERLDEYWDGIEGSRKEIRDTVSKIKNTKSNTKLTSLVSSLKLKIRRTQDKGYSLYCEASHVRSIIPQPFNRTLGIAGGVNAWKGFFKSLPPGWSVSVHGSKDKPLKFTDSVWFTLKVPMKPFTEKYKGAEVTFTWIQITITINGSNRACYEIGFQKGKSHKGIINSSHPHVDTGLCEGQASSALLKARDSWNIMGLYYLLHTVLTTPNYGGHSFYKPEDYTGIQGGRCVNCEWWHPIDTLKEGESCEKCGCRLCSKCTEKEKEHPSFSSCPKCVRAGEIKLKKERKAQKEGKTTIHHIVCKGCLDRNVLNCEGSDCKGRMCGSHGRRCGYCSRRLCTSCQTENKCKVCEKPFCGEHLESDTGCCAKCRMETPDKVKVFRKQKAKETVKAPADVKVTVGRIVDLVNSGVLASMPDSSETVSMPPEY